MTHKQEKLKKKREADYSMTRKQREERMVRGGRMSGGGGEVNRAARLGLRPELRNGTAKTI